MMIRLGGDGGRAPRRRRAGRVAWTGRLAALAAIAAAAIWVSGALASGGAAEAETKPAEAVTRTSAVLMGFVDPHGSQVSECVFEWGTTPSLGTTVGCSYSPGSGVTPVPVEAALSGLSESTTYYFRVSAKNANGESTGDEDHFTTPPSAPHVSTTGPRVVGHTTATLQGQVDPEESEVTECFFEYGASANELTSTVPCSSLPGAGYSPEPVSAEISGLSESSGYYYRLVAGNAHGTTVGDREHLLTLPNRPRTNTEPAATVGHTSATLRAYVDPRDALVESCYFEWGSSPELASTVPCEPSPGAGEEAVAVSAPLSGLSESTTYYYKVVASNSFGESEGGQNKFTTLPTSPHALARKAEEVSARSAVLRGDVNPEGTTLTECFFEWGTTPAFGNVASCNTLPSGESPVRVSTRLTGLTPATGYVYRLVVSNGFGTDYSGEERFSTFPTGLLPVVSKVSPKKGTSAGGTEVTIKGTNMAEAVAVHFGEVESEGITANTTTSVTAIAPPGAGVVDVTVTTLDGGTSEISGRDHYTYDGPAVTSVNPASGPQAGGTEVTVEGFGFATGAGTTSFEFGKAKATGVVCSSDTTCTMTTPAQRRAGAARVVATAFGKKSKGGPTFTYTP